MSRNEKVFPGGRKLDPLDAITDAAVSNEPTYSGNEGGAEDVGRQPIPGNENSSELSSTREGATPQGPRLRDPSLCYDMSGDKFLVIFNQYKYDDWEQPEVGFPSTREGTHADVRNLDKTFRDRGFDVVIHEDCTYNEIKKHVTELCEKNHTNTSCVAVAVMTHGLDTYLCAADIVYPLTEITEPLKNAPGLAHKPKLFFIQACRERHVNLNNSPQDEKVDIPIGADCLLLYSTYEDHVSYRNWDGTWMMKALCEVINTHHASLNLVKMVTLVNKKVAKEDVRYANGNISKQMSVTEFDLKKFLWF